MDPDARLGRPLCMGGGQLEARKVELRHGPIVAELDPVSVGQEYGPVELLAVHQGPVPAPQVPDGPPVPVGEEGGVSSRTP
jgi:hypothetical protein